jgi:hypothetical protein
MMQLIEREIETGFTTREKKGGWRGEDVAINSLTTTICTATDGLGRPVGRTGVGRSRSENHRRRAKHEQYIQCEREETVIDQERAQ